MRINKFVALATGLSRRKADELIARGEVTVNDLAPEQGQDITTTDVVRLGKRVIEAPLSTTTIVFNKPVGYVVSRDGQGSQTIYDILPPEYGNLKPIGRLDKYSSGLLLLTNDGNLANELTHPSNQKQKVYEVTIDAPLQPLHRQMISDHGIQLDDGLSKLQLERMREGNDLAWRVVMFEGRNRQIRRTFNALGYRVKSLHRTHFGDHTLAKLQPGTTREL